MKLFVSNLPYSTTQDELRDVFSEYGEISDCHMPLDKETGRGRGFGFVVMPHTKEALNAIQGLDQCPWDGRRMAVSEALEHGKRPAPRMFDRSADTGMREPAGE